MTTTGDQQIVEAITRAVRYGYGDTGIDDIVELIRHNEETCDDESAGGVTSRSL